MSNQTFEVIMELAELIGSGERLHDSKKGVIYRLLLESAKHKTLTLELEAPQEKERTVLFQFRPLSGNRNTSSKDPDTIDAREIERQLLNYKNLNISSFDTAYVFEKVQEQFNLKDEISIYHNFADQFTEHQREQIELTYWSTLNEYIVDFARNIVASIMTRRRVLKITPEKI